jgi:nitrate/nitrite transporter NarK
MSGLETAGVMIGILATLAGLGGAFLSLYMRAALAKTNERVAVLEAVRATHDDLLAEIRNDIKELLSRVRN